MVRHVPFRAGHYALAVQRPLQRRRARVAGKHRRDTHTDRRAAAFLEAPQGHVLVVLAQRDAIMLAQVLRLGRRAVTRQISGRGAEDAAVRRQRIATSVESRNSPMCTITSQSSLDSRGGPSDSVRLAVMPALRWRNCATRPAMWRCPKPSGATTRRWPATMPRRPASSSARSLISLLIWVARCASRRPSSVGAVPRRNGSPGARPAAFPAR